MKILRTGSNSAMEKAFSNRWAWLIFIAVLLIACAIRIRLLSIPFERDEGEYAYTAQLMLQDIPPYVKAYNMKMPGIYAAYAILLTLFGQTHTGVHLGLVLINAATAILIFLLARQLFGPLAGAVAGSVFVLLAIGEDLQAIAANAEHFVMLPALGAVLLLRRAVRLRGLPSLFFAGLLLGLAFMMKQHGAAFIVFGATYLLVTQLRCKQVNWRFIFGGGTLFAGGVFLPFALTCLVLWRCGVFSKFWFWTFDYARQYTSIVTLNEGLSCFTNTVIQIVPPAICLWILAGLGLIAVFWNSRLRSQSSFVTGFAAFSFLAVCPGLYFRPHYWLLFLPAASILAGAGAVSIYQIFSRYNSAFIAKIMPAILALFVLSYTLYQQKDFFFAFSPTVASRDIYSRNPFPESLVIANFIRQNSRKNDTIAVLGSEPQIYFYSHRTSATSYVYTYPLMEPQPFASGMQDEMISQIEQAGPKFLIFVHVSTSWLIEEKSEKKILAWLDQYIRKSYHLVGIVDIVARDFTVYRWGPEVAYYRPQSDCWITVLCQNRYSDFQNMRFPDSGVIKQGQDRADTSD